jgi:hypothetical protein
MGGGDPMGDGDSPRSSGSGAARGKSAPAAAKGGGPGFDDLEDDIPF